MSFTGDHESPLERKLKEYESKISRNRYETAYLFDQHGNLLFTKTGNEKSVRFLKKDLQLMHGNVLTHNHSYLQFLEPFGNTSALSSADLHLAYQEKPSAIRMVFGDERHSFQWTHAKKQDAEFFLRRLVELENGSKAAIERIDSRADGGKYKTHDEYLVALCETVKKYADRINNFFEDNSMIGYVFRRR
jgi:hypothetical protein